MKFLNLILAFLLLLITNHSFSQNAVIDFTRVPETYAGEGTYNPDYWANGGCPTYNQFGPNPLPVNGYNVRTSGSMLIVPSSSTTQPRYSMSLYAFGVEATGQRQNGAISVEYPFQANKTYLIEIEGLNDHSWDGNGMAGARYNGVFWVKLDNESNFPSTGVSPCRIDYTPVEKSVGRYSKLIADPDFSILDRNHQVKFSTKEAKSALKIWLDASPYVPGIKIDNIFRLRKIKITELAYEEDGPIYTAAYENIPRSQRIGPGYEIVTSNEQTFNPGLYARPVINSNQWSQNSGGSGYFIKLSDVIPGLYVSNFGSVALHIPWNGVGRPTRGETYPLPNSYQGNYFTFMVENGDVVIQATNLPTSSLEFHLSYDQ